MRITEHAYMRGRKRCGISKKALARLVDRVYKYGIRLETAKGKLAKYIEGVEESHSDRHPKRHHERGIARIYGKYVYIFSQREELVTVHQLPKQYEQALKKSKESLK